MTPAEIESKGFEALQRLYELALKDTGQAGVVGRFLLGLYNGARFPFELTELRRVDDELYTDCMRVLTMDLRLARREVHTYFSDGGLKFERLAFALGLAEQPSENLQRSAGKGTFMLRDGDSARMKLETYGSAPGYRDIGMVLGFGPDAAVKVDVHLDKDEAVGLMEHIQHANAFAWRHDGRGPIDVREGETRPSWVGEY